MNILRLDLLAFGPFQNVSLEFAHPRPGLHVVYGDNEAGKSTCLRAVKQWLFGMPHKATDDFEIPANRLLIGGLLGNQHGQTVEFVRRKGRKDTLRSPDQKVVLPDECLRPFLGSVDATEFARRFSLNHPELIQGGHALGTGSELGQVLFAAGAGIADIRGIQAELVTRHRALFLPTGALPTINARLQTLHNNRQRMRDAALSSQQWVDVDRQLQTAQQQAKEIDLRIGQLRQAVSLWQRLQKAAPLVTQWRRLQPELLTLDHVPRLPHDFSERRLNAVNRVRTAEQAHRGATTQVTQLEAKIQGVTLPPGLLEHQAAIASLHSKLGVVRKALQDRQRLAADLRSSETAQAQCLAELCDATQGDLDADWSIGTRLRSQLQELAGEYHTMTERLAQSQAAVGRLRAEQSHLADASADAHDELEVDTLKRTLRPLHAWRDVDRLADQAQRTVQDQEAILQGKLQALPLWTGTLEALIALPIPLVETLERHAHDLARCEQDLQRAREAGDAAAQRTRELERDAQSFSAAQDVPTEQELEETRRRRFDAWENLRSRAVAQGTAPASGHADHPPWADQFQAAAEAFWTLVLATDQLADRLRREADRVAQFAQIQVDLEASRREQQRWEANRLQTAQAWDDWRIQWLGVWKPLGIEPLSPREMLAWRRQWQEIRDQYQTCQQARAACQDLHSKQRAATELIEQLRGALNLPSTSDCEQLADALQQCEQAIERVEQVRQQRDILLQRRRQSEAELKEAEGRLHESQQALAQWETRWQQATQEAKLNPMLTARQLPAVLQAYDQWRGLLKEATQFRQRIAGIDRDQAALEVEVDRLRRLVPGAGAGGSEEIVETLFSSLNQAQKQQTLLEQWQSQLEEAHRQAAAYRAEWDVGTKALDELCQIAGCCQPADLPAIETDAAKRTQLESDIAQLQRQLQTLAETEDLDSFLQRLDQSAHEDLDWQISQTETQLHAAERQRTEVAETIGRLKRELDGMDGNDQAAHWLEAIQQDVAALTQDAGQYIRLRLAAGILDRVMDRYRQANQSGLLQRAGHLFAELTQGSFCGLAVESLDNGNFGLLGVRSDASQTVPPSGMSEGTCDQMYLAIRLALLEAYLDHQPPIPLLIDDLFITFDDRRSAAALQVLARLARRTQIIFFTHHSRLVELARTHLSEDDFSVQSLGTLAKP
jgi:uncharacterized protein YhaN